MESQNSLTTTHDRNFGSDEFPPKRDFQRNDETLKIAITTMQNDFGHKQLVDRAKPYRPPGNK